MGVTVGGAQNYKAFAERIARLMWLRWDEGTLTKDELAEYRVSLVKMISGVPRREKSTEQVMETARRDERRKRTLETQNSMSDLEGGKSLVESEPQQEGSASEPPLTEPVKKARKKAEPKKDTSVEDVEKPR